MRYLSREQARRIDRVAGERYGIPMIVLMENAARSAADCVVGLLGGECKGEVLILCGVGNNGGDGLALARHLHNRGMGVEVMLVGEAGRYRGEALTNYEIVRAMGIRMGGVEVGRLARSRAGLVVDAMFGTGLGERPREPFDAVAGAAMGSGVPILALDIPSGLDADTGEALTPFAVRAAHTITFVAAKKGFAAAGAAEYLGRVSIGDIGCPRELVEEVMRGA